MAKQEAWSNPAITAAVENLVNVISMEMKGMPTERSYDTTYMTNERSSDWDEMQKTFRQVPVQDLVLPCIRDLERMQEMDGSAQLDPNTESNGLAVEVTPPVKKPRRSIAEVLKEDEAKREIEEMHGDLKHSHHKLHDNPLYIDCEHRSTLCIVEHGIFHMVSSLFILLNAVTIGVEVQQRSTAESSSFEVELLNNVCNLFFLVELILRMAAWRLKFFTDLESRNWNLFDLLLVLASLLEVIMVQADVDAAESMSIITGLKTLKMLRIIRIFRTVKLFKQVALLAVMITDSASDLMWSTLMVAMIIYVFSIALTSNVTSILKDLKEQNATVAINDGDFKTLEECFGNLLKTVYTLLKIMLNGVSWQEVVDPLVSLDRLSATIVICYITFTMVCVLNILTGVFVDNALLSAKLQRDYMIQKQMYVKEHYIKQLRSFFRSVDISHDGEVSLRELQAMLEDKTLAAYFSVLGFDAVDADMLFQMLDTDDSGTVTLEEFLTGCTVLKGEARSVDIHSLMAECRRVVRAFDVQSKQLAGMRNGTYSGHGGLPVPPVQAPT